ncbi:MarR family winged helix-turn-helix transcriptional regulator [Naumannella halotolerans]|uniref:MarR family winged helix-turn-helix transcriptional regulator n=1 Tax=Naumannella halotolerans TaxID=993414 RepID=UPI00370D8AB6
MTSEPTQHPEPGLRTTAGLASTLRLATMRLARRLRQVHAGGHDLGANQLSTMSALMRDGELGMSELAEHEKVKPPSMTRIVGSLVELGMVERRCDDHDRRHQRVRLTAEGRNVVTAERRRRDQWMAQQVAALSPAERAALRAAVPVLQKLAQQ